MSSSSRRDFLAVAGASAAGVGVSVAFGVLAGSDTAGAAVRQSVTTKVPATLNGSLVAYIDDVHGDAVSVMIGDDEVVVRDPALVARLAAVVAHSKNTRAL